MFKISLTKDINTQKTTGIIITHGYICSCYYHCDKGVKCKYRSKGYKFHNWSVGVHRFFSRYLHIELPYWLHINKQWSNLSGTTKCPYNKSRYYSCWDCTYNGGEIDGSCFNEDYTSSSFDDTRADDPDWGSHGRCKLFDKNDWCDKYDKNTGEFI